MTKSEDTHRVAEEAVLSGHDRHLAEVDFPNGMRLTIVREDEYDAVTIWSEDGESTFTAAYVSPHLRHVRAADSAEMKAFLDGVAFVPHATLNVALDHLAKLVAELAPDQGERPSEAFASALNAQCVIGMWKDPEQAAVSTAEQVSAPQGVNPTPSQQQEPGQ